MAKTRSMQLKKTGSKHTTTKVEKALSNLSKKKKNASIKPKREILNKVVLNKSHKHFHFYSSDDSSSDDSSSDDSLNDDELTIISNITKIPSNEVDYLYNNSNKSDNMYVSRNSIILDSWKIKSTQ